MGIWLGGTNIIHIPLSPFRGATIPLFRRHWWNTRMKHPLFVDCNKSNHLLHACEWKKQVRCKYNGQSRRARWAYQVKPFNYFICCKYRVKACSHLRARARLKLARQKTRLKNPCSHMTHACASKCCEHHFLGPILWLPPQYVCIYLQ